MDDCPRPLKSKGLCGTHYQRLRRTGDVDTVRKPGRSPDPGRRVIDAYLGADFASPRGFARWHRATKIFDVLNLDSTDTLKACTRTNGTLNISKFERMAEGRLFAFLVDAGY